MATVKYIIRNKKSIKPVSINYDISLSSTIRLRGSTNIKVIPQYWDNSKQQIRNVVALSNTKDHLNKKLSDFKTYVFDKLSKYETNNINEIKQLLKDDVDIYLGKKEVEKEDIITFYTFTKTFIEQSENRVNETTGKKLSVRTIQDYNRTIELIKDFEKKKSYKITFDTINLEFYYAFKTYLEKLEFSANTIGKFIKVLKVFMNSATEQGYNTNLSYRNKHFIKPNVASENIYLNIKELQAIITLDLTENPLMDNARDLFIVGAYTGLRVSDFNDLKEDNIKEHNGKRFFNLTVKKTGKYLSIPLHQEVEKILKKHNNKPPKKMPPQEINDQLSKIGKKAKIKENITINSIKGGKTITETTPKYNLIKNHTARRSFCTNAYIAGMSTLDIMAISGHSSEKTFLNYIKITTDERAIKIANNPFFN